MTTVIDLDPRDAAARLVAEHEGAWVLDFADALDRRLSGQQLERVMQRWNLSRSELGEMFGVSRQAVSKWIDGGIPADRSPQVADLCAITDLLDHHLKRDRIPAVVRRRASALEGANLVELVGSGRSEDALRLTREMFAFTDLHS